MPWDGLFYKPFLIFRSNYVYKPGWQRDCYVPAIPLQHSDLRHYSSGAWQKYAEARGAFFIKTTGLSQILIHQQIGIFGI